MARFAERRPEAARLYVAFLGALLHLPRHADVRTRGAGFSVEASRLPGLSCERRGRRGSGLCLPGAPASAPACRPRPSGATRRCAPVDFEKAVLWCGSSRGRRAGHRRPRAREVSHPRSSRRTTTTSPWRPIEHRRLLAGRRAGGAFAVGLRSRTDERLVAALGVVAGSILRALGAVSTRTTSTMRAGGRHVARAASQRLHPRVEPVCRPRGLQGCRRGRLRGFASAPRGRCGSAFGAVRLDDGRASGAVAASSLRTLLAARCTTAAILRGRRGFLVKCKGTASPGCF